MRNRNSYPENWQDEIRPAILKRDNYKCVRCGVRHRQYIFIDQNSKVIRIDKKEHEELKAEGMRTYRVYLQVSHKDHNKENCDESNLQSVCPRCHHHYDKIHKQLVRLANHIRIDSTLRP